MVKRISISGFKYLWFPIISFFYTVNSFAQNEKNDPLLVPYSNGINFGFKDSITKKITIMPVFNGVGFFYGRYAKVKVNDKWGIINKKGDRIVEVKYDSIFILRNNIFLCYLKYKCYFLNETGKAMGTYDNFLKFEDNTSLFSANEMPLLNNSTLGNNLLYVVNTGGVYLNIIKMDTVRVDHGNGTATKYFIEKKSFPYIKDGKFAILNDKAETITPSDIEAVKVYMKFYKPTENKDEYKGTFLVDISDYTVMTKTGKRYIDLSKPIYIKRKGFWETMDMKGKMLNDNKFESVDKAGEFTFGILNKKKYCISEDGKNITEYNQ
ncbi:MAG: hypothetical protein HY958_13730 [Bacteroidia bacterium]|nr:hypothetical protein [Bacteroidia bacterium]